MCMFTHVFLEKSCELLHFLQDKKMAAFFCMAVFYLYGGLLSVWRPFICVAAFYLCGGLLSVWRPFICVAAFYLCGGLLSVWRPFICVAAFYLCGRLLSVWPPFICVAAFYLCGGLLSVWRPFFVLMPLQYISSSIYFIKTSQFFYLMRNFISFTEIYGLYRVM